MNTAHKRYSWIVLGTLAILMVLMAGLTLIADPQAIYQRSPIPGFNDKKPNINRHEWTTRALGIENVCANAALFGSSKILHGLSASEFFGGRNVSGPAYNFGIGFPSIVEISDFVHHAHSVCRLKQIVIGLDFFMFNAAYRRNDKEYLRVMQSFAAPYFHRQAIRLQLYAQMTLRPESMPDAFRTLSASAVHSAPLRESDWTMSDIHYAEKVRQAGGYGASFSNEVASYLSYLPPPGYRFKSTDNGRSYFDVFEEIVQFTKQEKIDLVVFISPVHARELVGLHILGLWDEFETFKRKTSEILVRQAEPVSNGVCQGPIDFAYLHAFSTETIPQDGSGASMQYWWESTHYKKSVGRAVMARLHRGYLETPDQTAIGRCLVFNDVDRILNTQRLERDTYLASRTREANWLYEKLEKLTSTLPRNTVHLKKLNAP